METIFKKTRTEKSVRNVYLVAFVLLLLSYLFTLYANRELQKRSVQVDHTNRVINMLDNFVSKVTEGETGVRGYLITKNIEFLYPYYGAHEKVDSLYRALELLTKDNPALANRLLTIKNLTEQRFEILRFNVKTFEENNRQVTDTLMKRQYEGKTIMENIHREIGLMQGQEKRVLVERGNRLMSTTQAITTITIISLTLAISFLIFGLLTYMQLSKQRKKGLAEIEEYQSKLNFRISELDEANSELIKMKSLEKFAATGRIARTIAHEIRNPLTNINLASEQLKDDIKGNTEDVSFLFDMIHRNSGRINQLISDLLNSTKFTDLNYESVPVNEFVEDVLGEAADRIKLNNIKVKTKYEEGLCSISVDPIKMKIALLNIIINAIEAMENRESSELGVETRKEGNKCRIIIRDNGDGIDKDSLSRIFEPYFTNKTKGNGLGLTNTQNIILNHKGEISVESIRGKGTDFSIILDLAVV